MDWNAQDTKHVIFSKSLPQDMIIKGQLAYKNQSKDNSHGCLNTNTVMHSKAKIKKNINTVNYVIQAIDVFQITNDTFCLEHYTVHSLRFLDRRGLNFCCSSS